MASKFNNIDFTGLEEYAETDRQRLSLATMIECGNLQDGYTKLGLDASNFTRDLRIILRRAATHGVKPLMKDGSTSYQVPEGYAIKGESVLLDDEDNVKMKWIKTDRSKEEQLLSLKDAITEIVSELDGKSKSVVCPKVSIQDEDLVNVYISNDLHIGALAWSEETGDRDYDLKIAREQIESAGHYLTKATPPSRVGIVVDLGDLTEMDDYKNATPHSGNVLDVDGRYSQVLRVAISSLIGLIDKAREKHPIVKFINIAGNHDITTALAVRFAIDAYYRNEPTVEVCVSPQHVKYYQHGKQLLGFAHGDGLKMRDAGETMAMDCMDIFSSTEYRDMHFGHTHKDAVYDGKLCRSESHRNIAPLNSWASHKGYRRGIGSMKAICYHKDFGEIGRNMFNVNMHDKDDNNE